MGWTRPQGDLYLRPSVTGAVGARGSCAPPAPRRELHEQQRDARAARQRRQPEMEPQVDHVAPGPDAHLRVLRMIRAAWLDGLDRVRRAPALVAGVFLLTVVTALPLAVAMRGAIAAHLGRSLAAGAAADGVNYDWWQEFMSQASGLDAAFTPAVIGFAATLDSLSSVADARGAAMPVAAALALYLLGWLFLTGGILDRLARQRPTRAYGFFAACGVFFWRFLRLGVIAGALYWALFTYLHRWLLDDAYERLILDVSAERVAFFWRLSLYA